MKTRFDLSVALLLATIPAPFAVACQQPVCSTREVCEPAMNHPKCHEVEDCTPGTCGGEYLTPLPPNIQGDWVLHIFVGKTLFDDKVHVVRASDGSYSGTLTVPNRFEAALESVAVTEREVSFQITGDEGHGKFQVTYAGVLDVAGDTFVGYGTSLDDGSLLGGFVAQRITP